VIVTVIVIIIVLVIAALTSLLNFDFGCSDCGPIARSTNLHVIPGL